jgi:predicted RNase H-like nuclease (RuvC/YqgF family)
MNVKVSLGNKLFQSENLLNEANARINELQHLLAEKDEENKNYTNENKMLKDQNFQCQEFIKKLELENLNLKSNLEGEKKIVITLEESLNDEKSNYKELLNINKQLKLEIENLNNQIQNFQGNSTKCIRDLQDTEKMKSKFENQLIEVTQLKDDLLEKIKVYEGVLKQKEKYINILIKKNSNEDLNKNFQSGLGSGVTINKKLDTIDTMFTNSNQNCITIDDNSASISSKKSSSIINPNNKFNFTIMHNKITELEEKLKQKDSEVKKLTTEKNNLMTRLRNSAK